jgi:hypothetical protein
MESEEVYDGLLDLISIFIYKTLRFRVSLDGRSKIMFCLK